MNDNEFREAARMEKDDAREIIKFLAPLLTGEGYDIIRSYADVHKARRMADLVNGTEDSMKQKGTSHDRLSGEIAGIVLMVNLPETLVSWANDVLSSGEQPTDEEEAFD